MCTKVTNEPPQGMRAGLVRSYNVMVDQDKLERIDLKMWRQLLYALCFMHTIVLERRKFGSLGWCQSYDFNNGDLGASMMFLEKHLYAGPISWPTLQYMVSEVQYGGKITDNLDRRLFTTYGSSWVSSRVLQDGFSYNPAELLNKMPNDFNYTVFDGLEIDAYRKWAASFPEVSCGAACRCVRRGAGCVSASLRRVVSVLRGCADAACACACVCVSDRLAGGVRPAPERRPDVPCEGGDFAAANVLGDAAATDGWRQRSQR
jgi:hypothetical protein